MFQTYDAMFSDTMNKWILQLLKEVLHMNEWMNHPKMQNMDPIKLELIKWPLHNCRKIRKRPRAHLVRTDHQCGKA